MERFIKNLARGAGAILRDGFRKEFRFTQKSAAWDIVTEFDLAADNFIIERIRKRYPGHGIISEESGHMIKKRSFWVIDPLDGTHAFARGIPQFAVSIAFVSNGILKFGAVYDPMGNELFYGQKHKDASVNGKPIRVSAIGDFTNTLCCIIMGSSTTTIGERKEVYNKLVFKRKLWVPQTESCALSAAYCAAGRYDAFLSKNLYPWDYSAGALIMTEAGAKVTDFRGKPYKWNSENIIASNPTLHKRIMRELK